MRVPGLYAGELQQLGHYQPRDLLDLDEPPGEATHWTAAMMSKALDISVSSVQRIWRAHGLQPHRMRQFKLSHDPEFVPKLRDIVGLYVDAPEHASC